MIEIIKLFDISKVYKNIGSKLAVLDRISFSVRQGEILCVLGASGCGKSTLLRTIGGFEKADSGKILFKDREVKKPSKDMIMIFQDFNQLFPWRTVMDNMLYPLKLNTIGNSDNERRQIALEYLEMVGLSEFKDYYPHQLSGGMKQRAAIARAISLKPEVLLMDEPFGSLDAITRQSLLKLLLNIWEKTGVTIIFVTHDIAEAITLSDRILIMGKTPHCIMSMIENNQKRPRNITEYGFSLMHEKLYSILLEGQ